MVVLLPASDRRPRGSVILLDELRAGFVGHVADLLLMHAGELVEGIVARVVGEDRLELRVPVGRGQ